MKPIIFSGPMVRAILDGRKTQTRRIARHHHLPQEFHDEALRVGVHKAAEIFLHRCPYGVPGDELWVRETIRTADASFGGDNYYFAADNKGVGLARYAALIKRFPWRYGRVIPSIFMPREASRLTLVVRSVRVERLSAITEADVRAEGFPPEPRGAMGQTVRPGPRDCFLAAFRQMHKLPADADPWLWVVTFSRAAEAKGEPK